MCLCAGVLILLGFLILLIIDLILLELFGFLILDLILLDLFARWCDWSHKNVGVKRLCVLAKSGISLDAHVFVGKTIIFC